MVGGDETRARLEVAVGIFGVDAHLDRVTDQRRDAERERLASGDADLLLHQVVAGDHLGHGMLDLDARVHLHEVERAVLVEEELDRPRAGVVDRRGELHRGLAHPCAQLGGERRRGRLLDQLLVAALHGAVALAQVDHGAVQVAKHLDLDVTRPGEILLDVDIAVAEGGERLVLRQREELRERVGIVRDAHSLPAAAGRRLDDHREADPLGHRQRLLDVAHDPRRARHRRHTGFGGEAAGRGLVAHGTDLVAGRADEGDVRRTTGVGELGILGEEAVARVNRIGTGHFGGGDQIRDPEIGEPPRRRPDADIVVGKPHVQRFSVGLAVHGDGPDAEFPTGANHAERDLAAIGHHHLAKHQRPRSLKVRSEAALMPDTRSANSLGLVAFRTASSYAMVPSCSQRISDWSKDCIP